MSGEREVKTGKISVSKSSFLKLPQLFYAVANIYRFPNPARTWISRCCTLYDKTDRSPAKIQITDEGNPGAEFKTLILENVAHIRQKPSKSKNFKVEIQWRKERFSFAVDSEHEATSWTEHLKEVAQYDHTTNKKISHDNLSTSSSVSEPDTEIFVNNLDYQSLDMWTYDVEMNDTEASLRCQLSGPFRLQLTKQGFFLLTVKERRVLYQWPYHFIRRYGKSQNTFTIQAGRKCDSGEGSFCFGTKPGENLEIFQKVNQLTLQLKASQTELAAADLRYSPNPVPRGGTKPNITSEPKKPNITSEPKKPNTASEPKKTNITSEPPKKTLHSPSVEIANHPSPTTDGPVWAKKALPFQMELQSKLSSHSDEYSNVNLSRLPSPDIHPPKLHSPDFQPTKLHSPDVHHSKLPSPDIKLPPVIRQQHLYSDVDMVSGKMSNLLTNPDMSYDTYSTVEVNNNHGSRNAPSQSREENYDRLDFNTFETPFEERQKNFQPYLYESVEIKSQEEEENVYEEAAPFTDERNACGRKLLPLPVVITHKPFMAPATVDDGYR